MACGVTKLKMTATTSLQGELTRAQQEWASVLKNFKAFGGMEPTNKELFEAMSGRVQTYVSKSFATTEWSRRLKVFKAQPRNAQMLARIKSISDVLRQERVATVPRASFPASVSGQRSFTTTNRPPLSQPSTPTSTHNLLYKNETVKVTVTSDIRVCEQWIRDLGFCASSTCVNSEDRICNVFGFDIEWTANTVKGQVPNPAATLQLATKDKAIILQLEHFDPLFCQGLCDLLEDEKVLKLGVGIREDFNKLRRDYGLECNGGVDLSKYYFQMLDMNSFNESWPYRFPFLTSKVIGLKRLAKEILNFNLKKPKDLWRWNWSKKQLDNQQITYAALDAIIALRLFQFMREIEFTGLCPKCLTELLTNVDPKKDFYFKRSDFY